MRKPKSFRGPGKVPGRVLRKPGKTGGPEKFRVGLDIFDIHLLCISKRFWNKFNEYNINGLPLTWKAQVGREHMGQRGPRGEGALGGSFQEASSPLGAALRDGNPRAPPRSASSSKFASLPPIYK